MNKEARQYFEDLKDSWKKFKELRTRTNYQHGLGRVTKEEIHPDYLTIQNREFIIDELFRIIK